MNNTTDSRKSSIGVPVNDEFHHDLSHSHITTLDFFRLQPVFCQEVIGGSTHTFDLRAHISSAPLATQVYGGCHLDLHAFFVPNRIVFENWNEYFAGSSRSTENNESLPFVSSLQLRLMMGEGNNSDDYKEKRRVFGSLGYPTYSANINSSSMRYSQLQARAYQKVWWDYYRDSVNIPESAASTYLDLAGGSQYKQETFEVRYRTFKKDFISTLLSNPQLGTASTANVISKIGNVSDGSLQLYPVLGNFTSDSLHADVSAPAVTVSGTRKIFTSTPVYALRGALAMQRYLERLNVTGTRPMERLLALLGAKPSAERLDMAEFLGGKTIKINIDGLINSGSNEQVSTGTSEDFSYNAWGINNSDGTYGNHYGQGYQTGYASGKGQSDKISYKATEDGHIIVIASLIPEYYNTNTVRRQFIRGLSTPDSDRFDFFHADFDGLGYQEILLSEVSTPSPFDIAQLDDEVAQDWRVNYNPFNVVGYEPKYEDYRRVPNHISGDFQEEESAKAMRYLAFTLSYPEVLLVNDLQAGLNLTTSNFGYRALFDKHFQISDSGIDHFTCLFHIVDDAVMPVTNAQLPTELSDLANMTTSEISTGGVRL